MGDQATALLPGVPLSSLPGLGRSGRVPALRALEARDEFTRRTQALINSPGITAAQARRLAVAVRALADGESPESVLARAEPALYFGWDALSLGWRL